jgi:Ca2+-binding EF-hand superfamily protein
MAHELTFEQIQESKRVFDSHKISDNHPNEEAKISTNSLILALTDLNFDIGAEDVTEMKNNMSLGNEIDFPTFLRIAAIKFKEKEFIKELESAFKAFDKHNHEYLSYEELRSIITDYGPKLSLDKADSLLTEMGIEKDRKFTYKDFVEKNI